MDQVCGSRRDGSPKRKMQRCILTHPQGATISLQWDGPHLFPVNHRYSKTPNAPPLCHSRSALSPPFLHSSDTLSKVRVLDHQHTSLRTRAFRSDSRNKTAHL